MRFTEFWIPGFVAAAVAALAACGNGNPASPSASGASHWQLSVGADSAHHALQSLDFLPSAITIDAGDTVTWTVGASEHTVAFLLPKQSPFTAPLRPAGGATEDGTAFTSSGILFGGQSYTLTFPKPGTYTYHCLLHPPEMIGKVIVQPAGSAYPHPQAYYTRQGSATADADLDAALASLALFPYRAGGPKLVAGLSPGLAIGTPSHSTVYRFLDAGNLRATTTTVSVGTTVTWVNQANNEPHTVTFPVAGHQLPRRIEKNPFSPPSGGSTYDGSALTNSGPLGTHIGQGPFKTDSYSLKFTKRGRYVYYCLFHDSFGMSGTVIVR
jgi:plastocyanin